MGEDKFPSVPIPTPLVVLNSQAKTGGRGLVGLPRCNWDPSFALTVKMEALTIPMAASTKGVTYSWSTRQLSSEQ